MKSIRINKKVYNLIFLILGLGLALLFRTFNLSRGFSGDEGLLVNIAGLDLSQIIPALEQRDIYPPLTYILLHFWTRISHSEVWIRSYFILFGIGTCFLIYQLAKEYFNVKFARFSLLLSSFSPLLIFVSQYVRSYIDSTFWILLSSLFLLRIIRGKSTAINWIGYIVSASLSLYTFYFSALVIFTQFIFVFISGQKSRSIIPKFVISMLLVGLIFSPWLPSVLKQFDNLHVEEHPIIYDWSGKGFNLGPLRLGLYARNIFSLIGFDPYFMVIQSGVTRYFPKAILAIAVILCFIGLIYFLYFCFRNLKIKFLQEPYLIYFFPLFALIPLISSWFLAVLLNTLPNAKYLASLHAFFLMLISFFIYSLWEKKRRRGILFIALILIVFSVRISSAVTSEFATASATSFLKRNINKNDCLICIRSCLSEEINIKTFKIEDYFKLNKEKSEFVVVSSDIWKRLRQQISSFKRVWFYRAYGNIEIFGANRLLQDWLKTEGYRQVKLGKFKNIDIIAYEK